jgi:hypothetical protein
MVGECMPVISHGWRMYAGDLSEKKYCRDIYKLKAAIFVCFLIKNNVV